MYKPFPVNHTYINTEICTYVNSERFYKVIGILRNIKKELSKTALNTF